jgi:hypothetical protein
VILADVAGSRGWGTAGANHSDLCHRAMARFAEGIGSPKRIGFHVAADDVIEPFDVEHHRGFAQHARDGDVNRARCRIAAPG